MAFTVTPTSGDAPYVFTAEFDNIESFIPQRYLLLFRSNTSVGSCSSSISGNFNPTAAADLLNEGVYTLESPSVPVGSCNRYRITVYDVVNNSSLENVDVTIDNV